ncbi:MAG: amidohydrolase [Candidatus Bipolaricaulota bacterium]|nr:amidohydrolase [Candidatus Bipolaricaulota bacterium]
MGTVLRDVRRFDHPGFASIRIADGVIDRVGEPDATWPEGDEVVEARGRLATPGLVNAHTHLPMVLLRGLADDAPLSVWLEQHIWPIERALEPDDVYWCSLLALAESIRCGVVAIADMYFHSDAVARAASESGLRALLSYGMIAPSLSEGGKAELEKAARFAAAWHGKAQGRIAVAISPHAVYTCGGDVWRGAASLAAERGLMLHTHLSETRDEVDAWRQKTGLTPPAYLENLGVLAVPTLAAHCVHVDDADIDVLARNGVRVAHCPKSNAKLGSGIAPVRAMRDRGVRVAIGTDGAASNDRLDVLEELRFACLVARAQSEDARSLSSHDALSLATTEGRLALNLPKAGIEPGDPADVVLMDVEGSHTAPPHDATSTLVFASQASDVTDVFVGGRPLLRDRRLLTIDEERVQSEVARLAKRLRRD